jgi:hypothetical protein
MIKVYAFWGLLAFVLAGCAAAVAGDAAPEAQEPAPQSESPPETGDLPAPVEESEPPALPTPQVLVQLENFGPAPELANEVWLNTDQPLRLADLRGQVVLLDMWTFG